MSPKTQSFNTRQRMKGNTFEVFRYKDAHPKEVPLHHHDFYEIYFFLSGNVQYNIESRSYLMSPGDILLISPMELHQPIFAGDQRGYERIVLWINKRFLEGLCLPGQNLTDCFDTTRPGHTNLLSTEGLKRQMLVFQLEQLINAVENQEPYAELYALSYLVQVMVQLNRLSRQAGQSENLKEVRESVLFHILTYINEHYHEDLTLDFLANKFFISKYHLSREFQRLVGTSVHRYIVLKRLVMARQMMSEGMSSSVVYQHCGFGDYSNFYRAFKKEYQMSPKEFLLRMREADTRQDSVLRRMRENREQSIL